MKLSKFCSEDLINFNLKSSDKTSVLSELVELAAQSKLVKDEAELLKDVREREDLVTTGVGYGVAFPHAKTTADRNKVFDFIANPSQYLNSKFDILNKV